MSKKTAIILVFTLICSIVYSSDRKGAYTMPYIRYEASDADACNNCILRQSHTYDNDSTACEATGQQYTELNGYGASVSWKVKNQANAISIRYNLPDSTVCMISIAINGKTVKQTSLTSYWMYEYILKGVPQQTYEPECFILARFDECHFMIPQINEGDILCIMNESHAPLGIDYVEIEQAMNPIPKPKDAISVTDYGAIADDGCDDLHAFMACIEAATRSGKTVYIPAGDYILSDRINIMQDGITITGAGIWYSNLMFTNPDAGHGGFFANASDVKISDIYCNTINNRRMDNGKNRNYKCFSGTYRGKSIISDIWENHFTVGVWTAGYHGESPTDGLSVKNSRIRYNYADGVNFAHGTSNSIVEFCNIRNCGDDGLASFSSSPETRPVRPCKNNVFAWNTIESGWRASGIGIFGGEGHIISNCLITDCIGSSGIRFTSDFPGNPFSENSPMKVQDCTIINCGTRQHLYKGVYGAIELHGKKYDVCNISFERIDIINSQTDAIRLTGPRVRDIIFSDITIYGAGTDMKTGGKETPENHRGCGIFCYSQDPDKANRIYLDNIKVSDCPDGFIVNINNSFKFICNEL